MLPSLETAATRQYDMIATVMFQAPQSSHFETVGAVPAETPFERAGVRADDSSERFRTTVLQAHGAIEATGDFRFDVLAFVAVQFLPCRNSESLPPIDGTSRARIHTLITNSLTNGDVRTLASRYGTLGAPYCEGVLTIQKG